MVLSVLIFATCSMHRNLSNALVRSTKHRYVGTLYLMTLSFLMFDYEYGIYSKSVFFSESLLFFSILYLCIELIFKDVCEELHASI